MKATYLLLSLAFLPLAGVRAQDPSPTPSVSTPADAAGAKGDHREKRREMLQSLTPEEREKLKTAREAAMADPQVKTAEASRATNPRGYRMALRDAMLRKDPSVAAILAKLKGDRKAERIF